MASIKYRPEIDGLRALAVVPVILFHMGGEWLPGGFVGVDVFFVISGYLITSIILEDHHKGTFSFAQFWLRRIRRILPALIVMVLVTTIAGFFLLYSPEKSQMGSQAMSALLSVANITLWQTTGDYWGSRAEDSLFLHTWSLSVEEQFYLFFPVLIFIAFRFFRSQLTQILLLICLLSLSLFLYGAQNHPAATFYLLPTRAWELGAGCILAILTREYSSRFENNSFLSSAGLLSVLLSYLLITGETGVSFYLILPVVGSVLIIGFAKDDKSVANRILTAAPMLYIGKISYSLYIWHWPILILAKNAHSKYGIEMSPISLLLLMLAVSIASYYFVEQTFRRNLELFRYILIGFAGTLVFSTVCIFSNYSEDVSSFSKTTWSGNAYNVSPNLDWPDSVKKRMQGIDVAVSRNIDREIYLQGGIKKIYGKESPEIVVLGSSHALMWSGLLDEISKEIGVSIAFYGADATRTFFEIPVQRKAKTHYFSAEEKELFDRSRLEHLQKWKPKVVIISARWSHESDREAMQDLLDFIGTIGSRILLIEQPPELFFGEKNAPQYLAYLGVLPSGQTKQYIAQGNKNWYMRGRELLIEVAESCDYCELVPIADIFADADKAWVLDGSDVLYIDDDHLSSKGSEKAKTLIYDALRSYFPQ